MKTFGRVGDATWLETNMPKPATAALESLSAVERASILGALLRAHPELLAEAELLAAGFLFQEDRHAVAEDVADELRALHLSQLADRAGPQWGGGYIDPHEAADEMLDEIVQPYLEDLDRVLTHAGTPDAVDNRGSQAIRALKNAGVDIPDGWLGDTCPAWVR
jgi:hypothetical protein